MLPIRLVQVLIPSGMEVVGVQIVSTTTTDLAASYRVYPVQYPEPVGRIDSQKFVSPKQSTYGSDKNYPGVFAECISAGYFREYHIAHIAVYPLQYVPIHQRITVVREMRFRLIYAPSAKPQPITRQRMNQQSEKKIRKWLKGMLINPDDISSDDLGLTTPNRSTPQQKVMARALSVSETPSALVGQNVDYLIITNDALAESFERLADWKTKKGLEIRLFSRYLYYPVNEWIGGIGAPRIEARTEARCSRV